VIKKLICHKTVTVKGNRYNNFVVGLATNGVKTHKTNLAVHPYNVLLTVCIFNSHKFHADVCKQVSAVNTLSDEVILFLALPVMTGKARNITGKARNSITWYFS